MHLLRLLPILALLLWLAPSAQATHIVQVKVGVLGSPVTLSDAQLGCSDDGDGTYTCSNPSTLSNPDWMVTDLDLDLDPDPTVQNFVAITNTSATTQSFVVSVTLPVNVTFGPPSLIRGSISGSLTEANNDNFAQVGLAGANPLYEALIDGTPVWSLNAGLPVNVLFSSASAGIGPDQFGIPVRESVAVATTTNIGITLRFTLTPGDTASFTSVFNVVPIPEPASAALLGLGLLTLVGAARRRARS